MSTDTDTTIRVSRTVAADPETVFRAWTEPERMKEWLAPEGLSVGEARTDLRKGGAYLIRMEGPEGAVHTAAGTYEEVDPPRRLVFTWDWQEEGAGMGGTRVTVELSDAGDGRTEVVLTHELFPAPEVAKEHEHGWTSILDRLAGSFDT